MTESRTQWCQTGGPGAREEAVAYLISTMKCIMSTSNVIEPKPNSRSPLQAGLLPSVLFLSKRYQTLKPHTQEPSWWPFPPRHPNHIRSTGQPRRLHLQDTAPHTHSSKTTTVPATLATHLGCPRSAKWQSSLHSCFPSAHLPKWGFYTFLLWTITHMQKTPKMYGWGSYQKVNIHVLIPKFETWNMTSSSPPALPCPRRWLSWLTILRMPSKHKSLKATVLMVAPIWTLYRWNHTPRIILCRLLSLNIKLMRFIPTVCVALVCPFLLFCGSPRCVHSTADGHVGCFWLSSCDE